MKVITVFHILRNPMIGGTEILIKSIINANADPGVRHFIQMAQYLILLIYQKRQI